MQAAFVGQGLPDAWTYTLQNLVVQDSGSLAQQAQAAVGTQTLSGGALAGIIVGVVVIAAVLSLAIYLIRRGLQLARRR